MVVARRSPLASHLPSSSSSSPSCCSSSYRRNRNRAPAGAHSKQKRGASKSSNSSSESSSSSSSGTNFAQPGGEPQRPLFRSLKLVQLHIRCSQPGFEHRSKRQGHPLLPHVKQVANPQHLPHVGSQSPPSVPQKSRSQYLDAQCRMIASLLAAPFATF